MSDPLRDLLNRAVRGLHTAAHRGYFETCDVLVCADARAALGDTQEPRPMNVETMARALAVANEQNHTPGDAAEHWPSYRDEAERVLVALGGPVPWAAESHAARTADASLARMLGASALEPEPRHWRSFDVCGFCMTAWPCPASKETP